MLRPLLIALTFAAVAGFGAAPSDGPVGGDRPDFSDCIKAPDCTTCIIFAYCMTDSANALGGPVRVAAPLL